MFQEIDFFGYLYRVSNETRSIFKDFDGKIPFPQKIFEIYFGPFIFDLK
jgi:hypothetical protein